MVGEAAPATDGEASGFDALSAAGNLKNVGIEARHAEAIAATMGQAVKSSRRGLATKQDLREEIAALRHELKAEIAALRHELKAEIAALRQETMVEIAALRQQTMVEIAAVREEMRLEIKDLEKNMSDMENRLTLRLGAAMVAVNTLMFLALQVVG